MPKDAANRLVWNDANSVLITLDLMADPNGEANMNGAHFTLPTLPLMVDNLVRGNSYWKANVWWIGQDTQVFLVVRSTSELIPVSVRAALRQIYISEIAITYADPAHSPPTRA